MLNAQKPVDTRPMAEGSCGYETPNVKSLRPEMDQGQKHKGARQLIRLGLDVLSVLLIPFLLFFP